MKISIDVVQYGPYYTRQKGKLGVDDLEVKSWEESIFLHARDKEYIGVIPVDTITNTKYLEGFNRLLIRSEIQLPPSQQPVEVITPVKQPSRLVGFVYEGFKIDKSIKTKVNILYILGII